MFECLTQICDSVYQIAFVQPQLATLRQRFGIGGVLPQASIDLGNTVFYLRISSHKRLGLGNDIPLAEQEVTRDRVVGRGTVGDDFTLFHVYLADLPLLQWEVVIGAAGNALPGRLTRGNLPE